MWMLLFLLAMLVRQNDRRRMALVAGTFVLVSGAVYFTFMAAWLNVFLAVGLSQPVRLLLAGLGLYIVGYIADDALMVTVAVLALSQGKLTERAGRGLKLSSGVVMLALGWVLLFRPEWLV